MQMGLMRVVNNGTPGDAALSDYAWIRDENGTKDPDPVVLPDDWTFDLTGSGGIGLVPGFI